MVFSFTPEDVCARQIDIAAEDGIIQQVRFTRGCAGNAQGVAALIKGMPIEEAIGRLTGIKCRNGTSCPDQLAKALKDIQLKDVG